MNPAASGAVVSREDALESVAFVCPFCGKAATFIPDAEKSQVGHALPVCFPFEYQCASEYLASVNRALE
jgi:hypothetical protein